MKILRDSVTIATEVEKIRRLVLWGSGIPIYVLLLGVFYYRYVPLVPSFQWILGPILLLIVVLTAFDLEKGILCFVFIFPLINILPYLFGFDRNIPHSPTALICFLFFFLGWLIHASRRRVSLEIPRSVLRPLIVLSALIFISAVFVTLRYGNMFPFQTPRILDLIVNVNGVRAGGAIMSAVHSCLNYLTGFVWFLVIATAIKSKKFAYQIIHVLSASLFISILVAIFQKYYSISFGNTDFFIHLNRLNGTFKDPNSFGIALGAFWVIALAMVFSTRKRALQAAYILLCLCIIFIFPDIGSRSGLLGLVVSLIVFAGLSLKGQKSWWKGLRSLLVVFLVLATLLSIFLVFSKQSNLFHRLSSDAEIFTDTGYLDKLLMGRGAFWPAASRMIGEHPVSGTGVGSYVVAVPNYLKEAGSFYRRADSAENYYLQFVVELGLLALVVLIWLYFKIGHEFRRRAVWHRAQHRSDYLRLGLLAGLIAVFVNYGFHSYIGSFEVKYFFWLLLALIFSFGDTGEKTESPRPPKRWRVLLVSCGIFFYVLLALWGSLGSLSLSEQSNRFGWEQNYGLYQDETDDQGRIFNWTGKEAGLSIPIQGDALLIPIKASHPGIYQHPVDVRIFAANAYFKKGDLITVLRIDHADWMELEIPIQRTSSDVMNLVLESSRVWSPSDQGNLNDPRLLGVALGRYWFRIEPQPTREILRTETVPRQGWQGKTGFRLNSPGNCSIRIDAAAKNISLRLNIRGTKAFGIGPLIKVSLDGRVLARTLLDAEGWMTLTFHPDIEPGSHDLSVELLNDFYQLESGQDRNVELGDVEIDYH